MTDQQTEHPPVPVHLVGVSADLQLPARKPRPRRRAVTLRTVVLTAAAPVRNLLGTDPSRLECWAQASGNDVVLAATEAQAQDTANETTGIPNADGYLLQKAATAPTPVHTTEQLWAAAAAYPAAVSLVIINEA